MNKSDLKFLDELEMKFQVKNGVAKVTVGGMDILISSDVDDEDQVLIQALNEAEEIYSVWCGKDDIEESFDDVLEEIQAY